jgi:hypothetical protein
MERDDRFLAWREDFTGQADVGAEAALTDDKESQGLISGVPDWEL